MAPARGTRLNPYAGLIVGLAAMVLLASCSNGSSQIDGTIAGADGPPNIVFILIDDLGWPDVEPYANEFHETPHINRLAADGMRFTNAYAASPVCSSTRASIQSGQYPARVGITDFIPGHWRPFEALTVPTNRTQWLPHEVVTVGETLREAGYTTGYYGKWHLDGFDAVSLPTVQGYEVARTRRGGAHFNFADRFEPPYLDIEDDAYLTDVLTDEVIEFIDNSSASPFFVTLAHFAVHVPLEAKEPTVEKYRNKARPDNGVNNPVYAAMIEHVDDSVGRVLRTLDNAGIADNTVVVFYSDNGGLRERFDKSTGVIVSSNAPLRDEKGTVFEGGIRVPLIVKWPGVVEGGSSSDALMVSPDIFPTLAEMAGAGLPDTQVLDGESLMPILKGGEQSADRAIYFHYPHYHHMVPAGAVRQGDWKLIEFFDDNHVELYDLADDIGESTDLAESMPVKAAELRAMLAAWREDVGALMPTLNEDFDRERRGEWGEHPNRPGWNPDQEWEPGPGDQARP
jgi:uncharacterized sulfatase